MTTPPRKPVFIEKIFPVTLLNQQVYYEHGGNPFKGLHRWYSRKPLSFSRASVLGSLLPADLTMEEFAYLLGMDPPALSGTPLGKGGGGDRKLYKTPPGSVRIQKVHDLCEQMWGTRTPTVMDAFAGGGSIPFEAVRYGLRVLASDLNPVAVVTMKAAMEYPLKFGAELQEDIDYWVKWVGDEAAKRLDPFFPSLPGETVQNYLWAHTVVCPSCESVVPLSPNWWLSKTSNYAGVGQPRKITSDWCAVKPIPNLAEKRVDFELVKGRKGKGSTIVEDPPQPPLSRGDQDNEGLQVPLNKGDLGGSQYDPDTTTTISRGVGKCPNCGSVIEDDAIKSQFQAGTSGHQLYAVAYRRGSNSLEFRIPCEADLEGVLKAESYLKLNHQNLSPEHISSGAKTDELLRYGISNWLALFNPRQLLTIITYAEILNEAKEKLLAERDPVRVSGDLSHRAAGILIYLAMVMDRCSDMNCRLAHWDSSRAGSKTASAQHSLNLMWNYPEVAGTGELWRWCADALASDYENLCSLLGIDSSTLIPPDPLVKGGSEFDAGVAPLIKSDSEAQAHSLVMDEAKVPTPPLSRGAGGDLQHLAKQRNLPYTPGHLPYNYKLVERAKELRKNMTPAESKLWNDYLKSFPDRVYRQRPIDHFIVDFYCPAKKIAIEIDGDPHLTEEGKLYDEERTQILEAYGLNVLRFTNYEVINDFESVCSRIATFDPPQPPLSRGEEDQAPHTTGEQDQDGLQVPLTKGDLGGSLPHLRGSILLSSADSLFHIPDKSVDTIVTDPPYYATIQYAELSDFFYVWQKRILGDIFPDLYATELTDKDREAVANPSRFRNMGISPETLANQDYEAKMENAFREHYRVLRDDGVMTVQFNHKDSGAWDVLAKSLIDAGFEITASWAVSTENPQNLHQAQKNSVSSTVLLVCRKRDPEAPQAWWDDIRPELYNAVEQRAPEFEANDITGIDLYLSAFGPALNIFSRSWPVLDSAGQEMRPEVAFNEARKAIAAYRFRKLAQTDTAGFDPLTQWYFLAWDAFRAREFPYDEARQLALAVGGFNVSDLAKTHKLLDSTSGTCKLLTPQQRLKKRAFAITEQDFSLRYLIDGIHAIIALYQEEQTIEPVRRFMRSTGLVSNDTFMRALEVALRVIPRIRDGKKRIPEEQALADLWLAMDEIQAKVLYVQLPLAFPGGQMGLVFDIPENEDDIGDE